MVSQYGNIIRFGRIDIWHQGDMGSYIPYRFQVFPSIYLLDGGYSEICSFNRERPVDGLKRCLEEPFGKMEHKLVR
jgi:hypothetical protein